VTGVQRNRPTVQLHVMQELWDLIPNADELSLPDTPESANSKDYAH
jgi:hypothetical protein